MTPLVRPRLLDLFCGAGVGAEGYVRAGWHVVGIDKEPQPNYRGHEFIQSDALLAFAGSGDYVPLFAASTFDAVHASPPCQFATAYQRTGLVGEHENLIPATRELLEATELPYVIENVENARPWLRDPVLICGTMFDPPLEVERHRLFETNWPLEPPMWPCRHKLNGVDRYPGGRSVERTGSSRGLVRGTVEVGSWDIPLEVQKRAMGVDWELSLSELTLGIPPAYTELIGTQLLASLVTELVA